MMWIVLLFLLGLLMISAEVILPGGIAGAIGGLALIGGCIAGYVYYDAMGGVLAFLAALVLVAATLYVEFRILPKTKLGKRAFLQREIDGRAGGYDQSELALAGKTAEALTMLSPSGFVRVDGKRYEAFCQSGQVPAGAKLKVLTADNFRLIVTTDTTEL